MKVLVIVLVILIGGCGSKRDPQIELIQDMMQSPAIKAQDYDEKGALKMEKPPEGTIPKGHIPYPEDIATSEEAEELFQNPLPADHDAVLLTGQKMYYTYCGVCHGMTGMGDGPVAEKTMLKPPSLVNAKIKGWKDGGLYHIITAGRGLMGSFAAQIPDEADRWALIHFIRRLQAYADEETEPQQDTAKNEIKEETTAEDETRTVTTPEVVVSPEAMDAEENTTENVESEEE